MSHFKNTNLLKNKKDNFKNKKTKIKSSECVICFEMCEDIKDNSIYCGKTKNICCRDCKRVLIETKNYNCPLCRSHPIKTPIYNLHKINIHKKNIKKINHIINHPKKQGIKEEIQCIIMKHSDQIQIELRDKEEIIHWDVAIIILHQLHPMLLLIIFIIMTMT